MVYHWPNVVENPQIWTFGEIMPKNILNSFVAVWTNWFDVLVFIDAFCNFSNMHTMHQITSCDDAASRIHG